MHEKLTIVVATTASKCLTYILPPVLQEDDWEGIYTVFARIKKNQR